jgi:large subunit ribosomal protein L32e
MADETEAPEPKAAPEPSPEKKAAEERTEEAPETSGGPAPTRKKSEGRVAKRPAEKARAERQKKAAPAKAPRRPTLEPELARLLSERRRQDGRRPLFVREQAHRYFAIGRWSTWRAPRGLQSKQRRHYGYRPTVVSIGFGSPRATRGLTPSGFQPVLVRTARDLEAVDAARQAALVARTVGTRKRILLEEAARRRGVHVLNPLVREREET